MVADFTFEHNLMAQGYQHIAGVDESGMGSFAGDVYVGVVILPKDISIPGLDDSKKKSKEERERLYKVIKEKAIAYAVATASISEIDDINIYWARFLAARRAIDALSVKPDYVLMDGNAEIPEISIPQIAIVKGDGKSLSIAAASIMAKVERDEYMKKIASTVHEDYGWATNNAYYSPQHIEAIKKHGKTKWHRRKYVDKY